MSSHLMDYNDLNLDVRELLSLDGGSGSDSKLQLDGVFSYKAKSLARLFCDLLGNCWLHRVTHQYYSSRYSDVG